jgi:hypothetical protein
MVGLAARRRGSFQLWLHTQSNAKQPSPSVLRPSHCSVESAKAGEGARCRAQLIGPSRVREPDAHHPGQVPRCPPEFLGALPALVGAHGLPTFGQWACGPMLSWIVLCAGQCAVRQYVARLMHRDKEENWAESNRGRCILGSGSRCILGSRGSGPRGRRTAAAPSRRGGSLADALPERARHDTEVQCLRDCLWAPLPASASRSLLLATNFLSWSASPEQPAPPALQMCQVLSREGLPALYDL